MKTKYTTKSKNCIEKCKDFQRCKPCGEITKGKAFVVEYAGIFDIQSTNYYEETSLLDTDCHIEAEANAELFKEAFNVANETGLSPIQLNERIKELEGLLQRIYDVRDLWKYPENVKTEHEEEARVLHSMELKIETALNNKHK